MTLTAILVLILAAAILVTTITAGLTWPRRRMPGAAWLFVVLLAIDVWLVGKLFELFAVALPAKVIWGNVQYFGIVVLPPAFLMLAAEITGRMRFNRPLFYGALWVIPLLTLLIIWTNEAHGLFRTSVALSELGSVLVINASRGWWFFVHTAYSYALLLIACVMFFRAGLETEQRRRGGALLFFAAGLSPSVVNIVWLSGGLHRVPLDITPFSLLLTGLLLFVVVLKHGYYDVVRLAWSQFAATASSVLIIINAEDRVVGMTQSAEALMECSRPDPVGRTIGEVLPEIAAAVAAAVASGVVRREMVLTVSEERRVYDIEISSVVDGALRRPRGRVISLYDITERKRIERMKSEFVSTVSHELRTPLTSISGALGLMVGGAMGELPEQARQMIDIAYKNSQRLSYLINDLLDMEKLAAGKLHFEMQRQPLLPLLEQILEANQPFAKEHQVSLVFEGSTTDIYVRVDTQRLMQVLANLISNAIKFSPAGDEVVLSLHPSSSTVRISVRDNGPGIPQAFRSQIFQKFSQADASDTRAKGGTGLGLAITRELVERMDGVIGFDSVEGEGANFWIELPVLTSFYGDHQPSIG